ncbi:putative ATP-dependent RNA helicase DHX57 isoform X2 [Ambystoma mexicanum]|uniref:putative ATP-dependent RNA helicase DHX57 isoform X2 n=1 Tax=Ambystoma mexicanum TaxID=8296 RepID=UPI0037E8E5CF
MNEPGRRKGKPNKGGGRRGGGRGGRGGGGGGRGGGGGGGRGGGGGGGGGGRGGGGGGGGGGSGGGGRGARFPRPGGSGGGIGCLGGGSKKGSNQAWDDGEDICFSNKPMTQTRPSNVSRRPVRRNPETSAPLQTLHMTSENQERVKELLRQLQGQELEPAEEESGSDGEEEYDDHDYRDDDDHYWTTNEEVSDVKNGISFYPPEPVPVPETVVSAFAIGKLSRYGFDRERCVSALKLCDCDVGKSLEHLLQLCLSETYGERMRAPGTEKISMAECLERRQEEVFVLQSICGDKFRERIQNRVWTIGLELNYLTAMLRKPSQRESAKEHARQNSKDLCRFLLRGDCRFGARCKFRHDFPKETQPPKDDAHLSSQWQEEFLYDLEIRFPVDNKYPFQAPLVAFHSTNENLPLPCRLHIAEFLFDKALEMAERNEPMVYALMTYLEDEEIIARLLTNTHHKYSVPPPQITLAAASSDRNNLVIRKPETQERQLVSHQQTEVKEEVIIQEEDDDADEVESEAVIVEKESYVNIKKKLSKKYTWQPKSVLAENLKICKHFRLKQSSRSYQSMWEERRNLPAWQKRETILDLLKMHQVLVVSGMTGCGKTTQIPQFILDASLQGPPDHVANIICTQPRRISAITVAERVAKERAERVGLTVGYQIRLESVKSMATRLLYCTTGVLLRRLEGDASLQGITHVVVDEVHERTEESDFLLLVLKDVIFQRPDIRVILMSATLNAELFSEYFRSCPVINIPGRTFPVDQYFLEDAIAMTRYVVEDGSMYARSAKQTARDLPGKAHKANKGKSYQEVMDDLEGQMNNSLHFEDSQSVKDSVPDQQLNFKQLAARYEGVGKAVIKTLIGMDLDKINLDLIEALLEWIVDGTHSYPPGAVLVFLPGLAEIKALYEQLQSNAFFSNRRNKRCVIYPLHSSLSNEEQQAVFLKPPTGVTKIILSTNIAETSITIDDIVYVIDSGKMREKRYDPCKGMESLEDTMVSRANALQRKGRAGRVASGVCIHLFTSHHYYKQLLEQQPPEIQRVPLEQLCLRIKILDMFSEYRLESVLSELIEPPSLQSLHASKMRLQDLGALTPDEKLTPLGYHLASLPVDVRIGKLMLFGTIFRCLDPSLTIAASLAFKSPFVCPWDKKEEANSKKLEFAVANSDHLALLQAYKGWMSAGKESQRAAYSYCRQNFLSGRVLQANSNADNIKLISAMLCAALYPNVVQVKVPEGKYQQTSTGAMKMQPKAEELKFVTKDDGYIHIHPSSVNFQVRYFSSRYLVYHEKIKTSRVFIRDCSMVSVYPLVLFGGGQVKIELQKGEFVISLDDGWIRFAAASHQVAELVKELRSELDQLLQDKIKNPTMDLCTCPRGSRIISMIVKLVTTQ